MREAGFNHTLTAPRSVHEHLAELSHTWDGICPWTRLRVRASFLLGQFVSFPITAGFTGFLPAHAPAQVHSEAAQTSCAFTAELNGALEGAQLGPGILQGSLGRLQLSCHFLRARGTMLNAEKVCVEYESKGTAPALILPVRSRCSFLHIFMVNQFAMNV